MPVNKRATNKRTDKPEKSEGSKFPRKAVLVFHNQGETEEVCARAMTDLVISPEMAALRVMKGAEQKSGYWDSIDVPSLMDQLRDQAKAVNEGDLANAEAMLMNQATALQSLFARLAERGMGCEHAPAFEANMKMALRAQSQCRAALETLATIKNPPVIYAKQANISSGHQQVNNGIPLPTPAKETKKRRNKLLEQQHGEWVDTGTKCTASGADKEMATVGKIDGATDVKR